jgi:hypothetical protein
LKQKKIIPMGAILETCEKVLNSKLDLLNENTKRLQTLIEDIDHLYRDIDQRLLVEPTSQEQQQQPGPAHTTNVVLSTTATAT